MQYFNQVQSWNDVDCPSFWGGEFLAETTSHLSLLLAIALVGVFCSMPTFMAQNDGSSAVNKKIRVRQAIFAHILTHSFQGPNNSNRAPADENGLWAAGERAEV